jgi:hydroxyacylglutathione hydrolase
VFLGQWSAAYRPVKDALLKPLADIFRDQRPERAAERSLATNLLSDYAEANLSALFGLPITSPPADRIVHEGDTIEAAGLTFRVLDIPGHSPGHVVFVHDGTPMRVFGGDVLFRGSIGRYDFPGGDGRLLLDGIRRKLFALPSDAVVYPGHGPVTTVGHEEATNPFLSGE